MFKHNLLLIFRNFKWRKTTFLINLIGFSTGLACALLIFLWVHDELNVDKFHEKDNRLFQVMLNFSRPNGIETSESTPGLLAQALAEEMPEVEYATAVIPSGFFGSEGILAFENKRLKANEQYVSKDYFNIFSYRLLSGEKNSILLDKNSVLLSNEMAMKLFNTTENVVGKIIEWKRERFRLSFSGTFIVSGIFEKPPANSTDQFDLIFSYDLFYEKMEKRLRQWSNQNPHTFLTLIQGTDVDQFNAKIRNFIKTKYESSRTPIFAQKYSERYLHDQFENGVPSGGRILYVRLFSVIALFILVIACVNSMNLSTARASQRMKEVGVKKVVGANRKALILQFVGESLLMSYSSLILAVLQVELLLPQFNRFTGKHLSLSLDLNLIWAVLGITFVTGLVAGSYPSFYLSGFKPAEVLKGQLDTSFGEVWVRKGLVVFQFIISVILIVLVISVYKQIDFIQTKKLGFEKDNVIRFTRDGKLNESLETFLYEVKKLPGIVDASSSTSNFSGDHSSTTGGVIGEDRERQSKLRLAGMGVNYDFFETLGIEVEQGRTFSREFSAESSKIIFNETAINILGIEKPVGKTVQLWNEDAEIIGVVKDFHFESFYNEVKPCFFWLMHVKFDYGSNIWVKINAGTERESIAKIKNLYAEFNPGLPFEYRFLDDDYQELYEAEIRVSILAKYFAGLAILISCLGLFGLAAFTAERRLKEIGIRKVLGSSVFGIVYLLSSDFTKMVFVAIVIALPVSYLIAQNWLDDFAYRIDLEGWYFASAGLVTLLITWITVGMQTLKAANVNPVQCLRDE